MERQNALLERIANAVDPVPPASQDAPELFDTDDEKEAVDEFKEMMKRHGWNEESLRAAWEKGDIVP